MKIDTQMDLRLLMEFIGWGATEVIAEKMRSLLIENGWRGHDVGDVPEDDWLKMLDVAAQFLA